MICDDSMINAVLDLFDYNYYEIESLIDDVQQTRPDNVDNCQMLRVPSWNTYAPPITTVNTLPIAIPIVPLLIKMPQTVNARPILRCCLCNIQDSVKWRYNDNNRYCNSCGLKLHRKKLLHKEPCHN